MSFQKPKKPNPTNQHELFNSSCLPGKLARSTHGIQPQLPSGDLFSNPATHPITHSHVIRDLSCATSHPASRRRLKHLYKLKQFDKLSILGLKK